MVKRKLTDKQVREIADELIGTCKEIDEPLKELGLTFDELMIEDCMALDEIVLCCDEGCGWWFDAGEVNDEGICEECQEDREDQ